MGGKVSCNSKIGKGTEFKILLTMNCKLEEEEIECKNE